MHAVATVRGCWRTTMVLAALAGVAGGLVLGGWAAVRRAGHFGRPLRAGSRRRRPHGVRRAGRTATSISTQVRAPTCTCRSPSVPDRRHPRGRRRRHRCAISSASVLQPETARGCRRGVWAMADDVFPTAGDPVIVAGRMSTPMPPTRCSLLRRSSPPATSVSATPSRSAATRTPRASTCRPIRRATRSRCASSESSASRPTCHRSGRWTPSPRSTPTRSSPAPGTSATGRTSPRSRPRCSSASALTPTPPLPSARPSPASSRCSRQRPPSPTSARSDDAVATRPAWSRPSPMAAALAAVVLVGLSIARQAEHEHDNRAGSTAIGMSRRSAPRRSDPVDPRRGRHRGRLPGDCRRHVDVDTDRAGPARRD